MKKKLVYHLYIQDDYKTNITYPFHLECLKKYSNIFDEAVFYVSGNEEYMDNVKLFIATLPIRDITIKVRENSPLCEVATFKEEILDNDFDYDGLIYFMHNKGVTDVVKGGNSVDNILHWVWGMYFYSLNFMDEVVDHLIKTSWGMKLAMYGSFKICDEKMENTFFCGTSYWLNCPEVKNLKDKGIIKIPKVSNRIYCEEFPQNFSYGLTMSHNFCCAYNGTIDFYGANWDEVSEYFGDKEAFNEGFNEIIEKIGY